MSKKTSKAEKPLNPTPLEEEAKAANEGGLPHSTHEEAKAEDAPHSRFLGDPSHAQSLLNDPERRVEGIDYVSKHGYERFVDSFDPEGAEWVRNYDDLSKVSQFCIRSMVIFIVANPHAAPYASVMPNNHDRKAYRALDDALRDAAGYSRYPHA